MTEMQTGKLNAGDWVEVLSKEEILATLESDGRLDGMPFMPEMFAFCGKRFQVYKRAHKTCDTVFPIRARRVDRAVHLETRCDGQAHGGCQAGCLLFWKDAWLKPVDGPAPSAPLRLIRREKVATGGGCTEAMVWAQTHSPSANGGGPTYVCQATRLPYATSNLAWWDLRQYIEDYRSGNVGLWRIFCGFVYAIFHEISQSGIGVGPVMEWFYDKFHPLWRGTRFPWSEGTIPMGQPTPTARLNLQPGELVRVKPLDQILPTLTVDRANRGMKWDAELVPYCGGTYRVLKRVTRIINEKTGQMMEMKNPCIVLDSVICQSRYSGCRLFCPRSIYPYFREIWLERAVDGTETGHAVAACE
jgi:hypothetical protein